MRDGVFYVMPNYQYGYNMCCVLWLLFNVKGDDTMITVTLAVILVVVGLYFLSKTIRKEPDFINEADTTVRADIEEQCSGCCGGCKNSKTKS